MCCTAYLPPNRQSCQGARSYISLRHLSAYDGPLVTHVRASAARRAAEVVAR